MTALGGGSILFSLIPDHAKTHCLQRSAGNQAAFEMPKSAKIGLAFAIVFTLIWLIGPWPNNILRISADNGRYVAILRMPSEPSTTGQIFRAQNVQQYGNLTILRKADSRVLQAAIYFAGYKDLTLDEEHYWTRPLAVVWIHEDIICIFTEDVYESMQCSTVEMRAYKITSAPFHSEMISPTAGMVKLAEKSGMTNSETQRQFELVRTRCQHDNVQISLIRPDSNDSNAP